MDFSFLCALLLLCWAAILIALRIRPGRHPLLWMTIAITGVIHYVVPMGLDSMGQLDAFSIGVWSVDNSVLKYYGLVYSTITLAFICAGYMCAGRVRKVRMHSRERVNDAYRFVRLCNWIVTLGLVGQSFVAPHGAPPYSSAQGVSSAIRFVCSYATAGLPVTVYWGMRSGSVSLHTVVNCAVFAVQTLLRTGERAPMLAVGLAFVLGSVSNSARGRIRWGALLSAIAVAIIGTGWQFVRWEWRLSDGFVALLQVIKHTIANIATLSLTAGELGYLYRACQAMFAIVPKYHDYLYGAALLRLVLLPLPRSVFSFKPQETQLTIAEYLGVGISGASRPVTFMGDSYINFGWTGPVAGLALGWLVKRVEQSLQDSAPASLVVSAVGPYAIALWLRGTLNGIYDLFVWWLAATIVEKVVIRDHSRLGNMHKWH